MWEATTYEQRASIAQKTENMIRNNGYPLEKYTVVTEDGYINLTYRIPYGKNNNNNISKPPVVLFHGFNCCSAIFVNQSRLAYYLADEGFDVWLPNNRGTTFSRKHKFLNPDIDKEEYWNFSWHEIGVYDTPAFVDFILEKTEYEKLFLIGHSQGVTSLMVFAIERPEYNEKIALCCFLGTPVIFDHANSLTRKFISNIEIPCFELAKKYLKLPLYEIPGNNFIRLLYKITKPNTWMHKLLLFGLYFYAGHSNYVQMSEFDFREFSDALPNSASIRQAFHFSQIMKNRRFAKYDYGPHKNAKIYGTAGAPLYDLKKLTAPVALFYGKNDMYATPEDMKKLEGMLGNVVYKYLVDCDKFNHVDFLFAKDCIPLLYCHISEVMKKYMD